MDRYSGAEGQSCRRERPSFADWQTLKVGPPERKFDRDKTSANSINFSHSLHNFSK